MVDDSIQRVPERTHLALTASRLYYMQDLTMEAIAHELGMSRSSVSRLLTYARDSGLVHIQINSPRDQMTVLEEELHRRYGVAVNIVPVPEQTSDVDRLERVAMSAARLLGQFFDSNMTLGVAWGSTMGAVSRYLVPKSLRNTEVVQLNGAGNIRTTGVLYASEILQRFASAYGAKVQQFPVPAFFDDPATKALLWRERSMRRVLEVQSRIDVALFGVGSPFAEVPSRVYIGAYLDPADFRSLQADGVVGDVATQFFRIDGSDAGVAMNARSSGPDFAKLRRVSRRVCVVAGLQKLASVRGALAAGLATDLVVDEALARALADV